jgi:diaminopimelate decarboxylase
MELSTHKLYPQKTPYYYYDMALLRRTLAAASEEAAKRRIRIHYALKANANVPILKMISSMDFGADCVSGGEVCRALQCGFMPDSIAFAGVGKSDTEIAAACNANIWCFNCESVEELRIIDSIAEQCGRRMRIALRINPNVDAHTHSAITTGVEENKFGIQIYQIQQALDVLKTLSHVELCGIHFHIGSQITDMHVFAVLCRRANDIMRQFSIRPAHINMGGGLGVDYHEPAANPIADFSQYFSILADSMQIGADQTIHVELGRSLVAQCGSLITKILYVKELRQKNFLIVDAGMTDLIRPALYDAFHVVENLTSAAVDTKIYDVAGPICESTDILARSRTLPVSQRGDLLAVRTAGAYGEIMASQYNLRQLPQAIYSDDI